MTRGLIIKALSGFYDVLVDDTVYTCKGRGVFRNQNITPLVGDRVVISIHDDQTGTIQQVEERQNELKRPPIVNVDQVMIVSSIIEPQFNTTLLDRFLTSVESKEMEPIIVLSKQDLANEQLMKTIGYYITEYEKIGYTVLVVSDKMVDLKEKVFPYLKDKLTVIAGQSGVGKSSLLNQLDDALTIETAHISKSLGRGRHTTRHVELFQLGGGFVADTPGFSALDFDDIEKENLRFCFPEIANHQKDCRFRGCLHLNEPHCAVKQAVTDGSIAQFRYDNYEKFLNEINSRKPRY